MVSAGSWGRAGSGGLPLHGDGVSALHSEDSTGDRGGDRSARCEWTQSHPTSYAKWLREQIVCDVPFTTVKHKNSFKTRVTTNTVFREESCRILLQDQDQNKDTSHRCHSNRCRKFQPGPFGEDRD